jgi:predicted nucleic acid-binding protein
MRTSSSRSWPSPPSWSPPTETVELVRDPDDNHLIEAAMAAHADIIVTGDQDLLTLGCVDQIGILTPHEFLEALQPGT